MANKGSRCTVCQHPKVNEINGLLVRNAASFRDMGRQFELKKDALYRHRCEHLPERLAKSSQMREMIATNDLVGQLQSLQERASIAVSLYGAPVLDASGKPTNAMVNPAMALRAMRECRENLRLMGEVLGKLKPQGGPVINVTNTGVIVVYEMPSDGRGPGERAQAVARFREKYADLLPAKALALLMPGETATPQEQENGKPRDSSNGRTPGTGSERN